MSGRVSAGPGAHESKSGAGIPDELHGHEPVRARRPFVLLLGYGAVTTAIVFAFLLQILNGVCPVP